MTDAENKTFVVIDGNSLINRAYYAIQRPMITKEGIFTQGVYGFITMLQKILADYEPGYIAVAFDMKAPTFRHKEYAEYKAGRKKMPLELVMQMPIMKDVLSAMNIKILEIEGFEADDIIGTVAKAGEAEGLEPLIITGDKDELQLATDVTKILITKRGISEFEIYDRAKMFEIYGFGPDEFIDYKGLMGDSSDNIPGLPGVGEKTASKLILEFGSVENLLENADKIESEKLREKVKENALLAIMSKRLATIVTNVPIEIDFSDMEFKSPNVTELVKLYTKLEFNTFIKKLKTSGELDKENFQFSAKSQSSDNHQAQIDDISTDENVPAPVLHDEKKIRSTLISDIAELKKAEKEIAASGSLVFKCLGNNDHKDKPIVYGINIMSSEQHWYLPIDYNTDLLAALCDIISKYDISLIGHAIQSELYMIYAILKSEFHDQFLKFDPPIDFDNSIAQYLIDPSASDYSIKTLAMKYFIVEIEDEPAYLAVGGQINMLGNDYSHDADYGKKLCNLIISLKEAQVGQISKEGLEQVLLEAELPLIVPLAETESEGFALDKENLSAAGADIGERIDALTHDIYEISGEEFNINSPRQLADVLFEKMHLPYGKKNQRGYATSADVLEKLRDQSPIIDKILDFRTLMKLKGTYIDGLAPLAGKDGKIHAHFQQTVTTTGRISCTEPNLQNIPIRQEEGRKIRKAFVPENSDYILMGADYSQIELRILAHLSGDPALIEDFRSGADIHRRTAARVFDVENEEDVTPLQRSNAKAVNFGIIYGISSFGLSEGLGISRSEADGYIRDYFDKHSEVKAYLDNCIAEAKQNGYVTTILGRKRSIPEILASNYTVRMFGERLAMNSPIQGSAADIIKLAMIAVYKELRKRKLRSAIILQVHDELILQTHREEEKLVAEILREEMERAYKLDVPLVAEVNTGDNWYDLK